MGELWTFWEETSRRRVAMRFYVPCSRRQAMCSLEQALTIGVLRPSYSGLMLGCCSCKRATEAFRPTQRDTCQIHVLLFLPSCGARWRGLIIPDGRRPPAPRLNWFASVWGPMPSGRPSRPNSGYCRRIAETSTSRERSAAQSEMLRMRRDPTGFQDSPINPLHHNIP